MAASEQMNKNSGLFTHSPRIPTARNCCAPTNFYQHFVSLVAANCHGWQSVRAASIELDISKWWPAHADIRLALNEVAESELSGLQRIMDTAFKKLRVTSFSLLMQFSVRPVPRPDRQYTGWTYADEGGTRGANAATSGDVANAGGVLIAEMNHGSSDFVSL
jgi:hypothetical protein